MDLTQTDLREILDIPQIQSITDAFYAATGIPTSIITVSGEILTGAGWQDACVRFHRNNPESLKICMNSDTMIREGLFKEEKSIVYRCPHGLIDAAAPIVVDGNHIANYFTGQFLFEPPDNEKWSFFENQAERYGFDKTAYFEAVAKLPVIPEERVESILEYLARFAGLIAQTGFANLQNQRYARELEQARDNLEKTVSERTESLKAANLKLKTEIEARKRAEAIVSEEREKMFNLLNSLPAFLYLQKSDYSIAFANQTFKTMFGDDLSRPCYELIQNRDAPCDPCPIFNVFDTRNPAQWEWRREDGATYQIYDYPFYDLNGELMVVEMGIDITGRKLAETRLKKKQEQYKKLVNGSPDILYRFSKNSGGFYVSERVEKILGYAADYLMKNPYIWYDSIHPDDKPLVDETIARFWEGSHFKIEYRIRDARGNWRWLYDRSVGRRMEQGDIIIEGLAMDITDRKNAEERFKTFFTIVSDIFCIADIKGYFRLINPAAQNILGYSEDELLARPFLEFVHPDDRDKTLEVIHDQLQKGFTVLNFSNRYICKDGTVKWLEWTSHPVADQDVTFAAARDCTERLRMENAIKASEIWMRNIYNTLEEGVFVQTPERKILSMNRAALDMYGYDETELTGQPADILHVDRARFLEFDRKIKQAFDQGVSADFEFQGKRKNGEIFPTEHTVSLLKDESEKMIGVLSVVRDISDRKQTEKALRETMRDLERYNAELQQFAYIASHDLQEPLRSIAGFLQLLQSRYSERLDEKGRHYIERTVNAAHRMQALINDILALSRVNTRGGEFQTADLNPVLMNVLENLENALHKANARISYESLPSVFVDAHQIQSLFQNLIQNAVKYVADNDPVIEIGCDKADGTYRFYVKDNGIGVDPKFHDRIFMVFQRLHTRKDYPGTGIGLALCKKIVERHGGEIWVESEADRGAVFYFTLPE